MVADVVSRRPRDLDRRPEGRSDITMERPANPRLLGIDFGGTKMAIGGGDTDGRLLVSERLPTIAEQGAQQALSRALDRACELAEQTGGTIVAAGIARPASSTTTASNWRRTCPAGSSCGWPRRSAPT
ncbi:hypothetical protein V2I01_33010 [Micromonospora sp. BRA006-A]|nr:hypothetical protein [Micromonospora sp. BRA006-A]